MGLLRRAGLLQLPKGARPEAPLSEEDRWLLEGFLANAVDALELPNRTGKLLPHPGPSSSPLFSEVGLSTIAAFGILSKCRGDDYDPANPVDLSAIVVRDFALQFEFPEEPVEEEPAKPHFEDIDLASPKLYEAAEGEKFLRALYESRDLPRGKRFTGEKCLIRMEWWSGPGLSSFHEVTRAPAGKGRAAYILRGDYEDRLLALTAEAHEPKLDPRFLQSFFRENGREFCDGAIACVPDFVDVAIPVSRRFLVDILWAAIDRADGDFAGVAWESLLKQIGGGPDVGLDGEPQPLHPELRDENEYPPRGEKSHLINAWLDRAMQGKRNPWPPVREKKGGG